MCARWGASRVHTMRTLWFDPLPMAEIAASILGSPMRTGMVSRSLSGTPTGLTTGSGGGRYGMRVFRGGLLGSAGSALPHLPLCPIDFVLAVDLGPRGASTGGKTLADQQQGGDLFIVDNSDDDWKVRQYLQEWADLSHSSTWLPATSRSARCSHSTASGRRSTSSGSSWATRSPSAPSRHSWQASGGRGRLDPSLESEKERNDFLEGVPGHRGRLAGGADRVPRVRQGRSSMPRPTSRTRSTGGGRLRRIGRVEQSHAPRHDGQCRAQRPDQARGRGPPGVVRAALGEAEDVPPRRCSRSSSGMSGRTRPSRSMRRRFRVLQRHERPRVSGSGRSRGSTRSSTSTSTRATRPAQEERTPYGGAFLCDGVGLGKTYVGLMLIERLSCTNRKNVALFVPKAARAPRLGAAHAQELPHLWGG